MIKQTYSVYVHTAEGMKKWHLNAYWTQETLDRLLAVDDIPELRSLEVPPGTYLCARTNRMRESVSRSARNLYSEGSVGSSPSASPSFSPYPPQRHSEERRRGSPLSPTSPIMTHATNGAVMSPRMYTQGHGLALAPLELLEECRRFRRDPTDEVILRSFT